MYQIQELGMDCDVDALAKYFSSALSTGPLTIQTIGSSTISLCLQYIIPTACSSITLRGKLKLEKSEGSIQKGPLSMIVSLAKGMIECTSIENHSKLKIYVSDFLFVVIISNVFCHFISVGVAHLFKKIEVCICSGQNFNVCLRIRVECTIDNDV